MEPENVSAIGISFSPQQIQRYYGAMIRGLRESNH
jgi:hypothetical protein